MLTLIIFFAILLVLVLSHEFGHFLFAKLAGVKVEEFAFGFPPRIGSFWKGETRYSFNLVPLGGFVKIFGEEGEEASDPRSFSARPFGTKFAIIAAGVFFNFLLAYFLLSAGFMLGTPTALDDADPNPSAEIKITEIQRGSPAGLAGLLPGDTLVSLNALEAKKISEVQAFINGHKGQTLKISVKRGGEVLAYEAQIRSEVKPGEGALGIAMARFGVEKLSFFPALAKGLKTAADLTALTARALARFFGELFTGRSSFETVSGPVGIVGIVGDFSRFGFLFLIQLTALLSVNLALINIIPFPGLDGGRAFFLILEKLKGSPFHWKFTRAVHAAGFIFLLLLMILVTYHDILKLNS